MSKANNESSGAKLHQSWLVPAPFQQADKKVKMTMRSVPDTLRTAATRLLERVRVGLDIPSRAEVMDLAARIRSIANTLEKLEVRRREDAVELAELKNGKLNAPSRPVQVAKSSAAQSLQGSPSLADAAASLRARPKAKADFKAQPKPGAKKSPKASNEKAKTKASNARVTGSNAVASSAKTKKKKSTNDKKKTASALSTKGKAKTKSKPNSGANNGKLARSSKASAGAKKARRMASTKKSARKKSGK